MIFEVNILVQGGVTIKVYVLSKFIFKVLVIVSSYDGSHHEANLMPKFVIPGLCNISRT